MITQDTPYIITPEMIQAFLTSNGIQDIPPKRSTQEFLRRAKTHAVRTSGGNGFNSATDIDILIYGQ